MSSKWQELKEADARRMLEEPHETEVQIEKGAYPLSLRIHTFLDGTIIHETWVTDEEGRPYADYSIKRGE